MSLNHGIAKNNHSFHFIVTASSLLVVTVVAVIRVWWNQDDERSKHYCVTKKSLGPKKNTNAYESLIGNTPMVFLPNLSALLQRQIYVKMENYNPAGTGKDRAAFGMIRAAEEAGLLPATHNNNKEKDNNNNNRSNRNNHNYAKSTLEKTSSNNSREKNLTTDLVDSLIQKAMKRSKTGGLVIEGTSGSTGIAVAAQCAAKGHACIVVLPDDQAMEKQVVLNALGCCVVHVVPTAAISNPNHYVNQARVIARRAREDYNIDAVFLDQFENEANFQMHYEQTGPELWQQCNQKIDAFVMSAGTGGTIAGVGKFLKEKNCDHHHSIQVVLVDPPGSSLYSKIEHGVAFTIQQKEQGLRRHRYDTIAEGIGLDRVTQNLNLGLEWIDSAIRVTDQEALDMAHWILDHEGLWVGSSSAMNLVGAVQTAMSLPPNSKIVTIICDSGQRHVTRFWNPEFIREWGLIWPRNENDGTIRRPECLQNVL